MHLRPRLILCSELSPSVPAFETCKENIASHKYRVIKTFILGACWLSKIQHRVLNHSGLKETVKYMHVVNCADKEIVKKADF